MALINAQTGEAVIDGSDHRLIFTAAAFVQVETMLGISTPEIIQRVQNRQVGFRELQALVAAGMDGWASRQALAPKSGVNPTKALRIVEKYGWLPTLDAVGVAVLYSTALGILSDEDRQEGLEAEDDDESEAGPGNPGTGPV